MNAKSKFNATVRINIDLDEEEARALEALAGYSTDSFLRVFYKEMGEHYLKPHEAGLRRVFETFTTDVRQTLRKMEKAKELFMLD